MNDLLIQIADNFKTKEIAFSILREIKSGKEATVYRVILDGKLLAMKVYQADFLQKQAAKYSEGKFYQLKSEARSVFKKNKVGRKLRESNWVKREFYLMQKLFKLGANVPEPVEILENAIFMSFIGDDKTPAPRLSDLKLSKTEAELIYIQIKKNLEIFKNIGIAHGDLSPYNILFFADQIWIIDFPQAVDLATHPDGQKYLDKDLETIQKWYDRVR